MASPLSDSGASAAAPPAPPGGALKARRAARAQRLDALIERARRTGLRALDDVEWEDLGRLYRSAAHQLAVLRAQGASARTLEQFDSLVARGHALLYARLPRRGPRRGLLALLLAFPETVRRTAIFHLLAAALFLGGMLYGFAGSTADPDWALEFRFDGADTRTPYATREALFDSLRSGQPPSRQRPERPAASGNADGVEKAAFAAFLWSNNTRVSLLAMLSGFLGGVPTVWLTLNNGTLLGCYSYTFHSHGLGVEWWAWILPHGVTEILALVLLAGGGLFLARLVLLPGEQSRAQALRAARPDILRLLLCAFAMDLAAALLESYLRQSALSDPARYLFAAASALFWILYLGFVRSPRAPAEPAPPAGLRERAVDLPGADDLLELV